MGMQAAACWPSRSVMGMLMDMALHASSSDPWLVLAQLYAGNVAYFTSSCMSAHNLSLQPGHL